VASTVNQNNTLLKVKEEMNVAAMLVDKDKFYNNLDKPKGERYQAWLTNLKTDMHIDESVKMVSEMVRSQGQATVQK
jgi:carboxyl-terminal processing protease